MILDSEKEKLLQMGKESWDARESLDVVRSTIWQDSRALYDLKVDGVTVGDRLNNVKEQLDSISALLVSLDDPICPKCQLRGKPVITSFAARYEPTAVLDDPRAAIPYATGEFACPKCHGILFKR